MLIDTHAHLNFENYQDDLGRVLQRSVKNDVQKIICIGGSSENNEKVIALAKRYPDIISAAGGLHPLSIQNADKTDLEKLDKLASSQKIIAIGECGLDYYRLASGFKKQKLFFKEQIKIARKYDLPLIIHTRKAFADTLEIVRKEARGLKGVFHCYSAGKKGIESVLETGFLFGVDGNLTYDEGLQKAFALIPLEKIVLETDAPFLTPAPHRGQRNEPAYLKFTATCLAEVKSISFEEVAKATTKNAKKLFKI